MATGPTIAVWSYHSPDDGATFAGTKNVIVQDDIGTVLPRGYYRFTDRTVDVPGYQLGTEAVRVVEHNTLVPVSIRIGGVYRDGFIVLDTTVPPSSTAESQAIYFKRGENRGQPAWV